MREPNESAHLGRHYQDDWQAKAGDPRLPYWLRVAALACGSHADHGHARFKQGEVALVLGSVDPETGDVRRYANVRRAIALAVESGWLEYGSYWGCLIVPAHSIRKGDTTIRKAPCALAAKHKERQDSRLLSERLGFESSTLSERFQPETAHSSNGSQREPLLSVLYPPHADRQPAADPQAERRRRPA